MECRFPICCRHGSKRALTRTFVLLHEGRARPSAHSGPACFLSGKDPASPAAAHPAGDGTPPNDSRSRSAPRSLCAGRLPRSLQRRRERDLVDERALLAEAGFDVAYRCEVSVLEGVARAVCSRRRDSGSIGSDSVPTLVTPSLSSPCQTVSCVQPVRRRLRATVRANRTNCKGSVRSRGLTCRYLVQM